jgi:hypothetical protein
VSRTADSGQHSLLLTFCRFFTRTSVSRVKDCCSSAENSEISGGRQVFGLRQRFDHFNHGKSQQLQILPSLNSKGFPAVPPTFPAASTFLWAPVFS